MEGIAKLAQIIFEVSGGTLKAHPLELGAAGESATSTRGGQCAG